MLGKISVWDNIEMVVNAAAHFRFTDGRLYDFITRSNCVTEILVINVMSDVARHWNTQHVN